MDFKGELYRWNITDHYGWDVNLQDLRDIRLGNLLNDHCEEDDKFLYHIILHDKDSSIDCDGIQLKKTILTFYPIEKRLKVKSYEGIVIPDVNGLYMNFKAENIKQCENIIEMILEPNNLVVFDKYKIK
jgi:hypothetical protein